MIVALTRTSRLCRPPGRGWPSGACFALAILLALPATGEPPISELVSALELSAYPSGWRPPPFAGATVAGRRLSLADFQGRVVLVNFWATWCSSCLREMPVFELLHGEYAPAGLTVLGVNIQENEHTVQKYGEKLGLGFPLIPDLDGTIAKVYGAIAIPSTYVIGRDGRAIALAVGSREWGSRAARALIEALLAEPAVQRGAR